MRLDAVLYVYQGEWSLPTIDFECMRALCLVKFTRCPVRIETSANPLRSGAGILPYLQIGNEKFVGYRSIKQLLDQEGYAVDTNLADQHKQLSPAYANWVFTQLHGYFNYYMFGEPNNYEITRALYAKRTPFPFNFYYPATYQKRAHDIVFAMANFDFHDKIDKHESDFLTVNAKKCINVLSKKLGRQIWFFGEHYSELDAIVYAYIAIILKISLPNNPLQNHIKGCQNLVNFFNRISRDIFRNEAFNSIKSSKSSTPNASDPMLTPTERSFMESEKKTKILAGIGAAVAMGTFAAWKVLYNQISSSNRAYYENFEYDDDDEDDED